MPHATEDKGLQSMENYLKFHTAQHPRILQLSEHTSIKTISHCMDQVTAELNGNEYSKKIISLLIPRWCTLILMFPKHFKFATLMQNYLSLYYNSVLHTGKVKHEQVHSFLCISSAPNMLLAFTRIKVTETNFVTDNPGANLACLFVCLFGTCISPHEKV